MQRFKSFYIITNGLLLLVQGLFLFLLAYNKLRLGEVLYFGNSEEPNIGFEKYFTILQVLLYSTFVLIILWAILTPFAVISNRRLYRDKINISIGLIGFFLAVGLLLLDPFGIFKWFTN